jgi:cytosine/adenosine deaminase-related metal-dependent hydrolase
MVSKKRSNESQETTGTPDARGDSNEKSRRRFLNGGIGVVAGVAATQLLPHPAAATPQDAGNAGLIERLRNPNGRPILLKDGIILSMDPQVGDFEKGDVLLQGKKIVSVGPNVEMPKSSVVVNAAGMIVMPGMIDTHHHQYEAILRSILADGVIPVGVPGPKNNYTSVIQGTFTPVYLPEDAHIAELLASLSQINDGVTTAVDTSQVQLTPDHTDACIAGLKESGRRALFAYGAGGEDAARKFPVELARLRKQYFSSPDQLLTLGTHVGTNAEQWKIARSVGTPIVTHIVGAVNSDLDSMGKAGLMGPDNEYIHCTRLSDSTWKTIADTGGKISIAVAIEMQMQHGYPPIQQALDHGLRPSLSVDVECNMTADLFSVMRATFTMQRVLANERIIAREENAPALITCRDVIEFATIDGARAAHLDSKVGSLTPGKEADIVMLATDRLNTFPLNNVPGAIVTLMDTSNVENVFIAGKVVKWQGKLVGVDLSRIKAQAEKSRDGLLARSKFPRNLFGSCCIT